MLSPRKHLLVLNLYEELGSFRAVAEIVDCDHKTVKAHVVRNAARQPLQRGSVADPYREIIRGKLDATAGQITAKALFRIVRAAGYEGSARTMRRAVALDRAIWRSAPQHRVYRPWNSAPGDVLVVDWGHAGKVQTAAGLRPLSVFCAVLGWSRYRFIRFTTSQKFASLAGCLATCFEQIGGVPGRVMFDNPNTVTTSFVAGQSVFNVELVRLAAHYPFSPISAAAADPESKGKVEALVRYVKIDCLPADGFASLAAANRWAQQWMDDANAMVHPETRAVPATRLNTERQLLRMAGVSLVPSAAALDDEIVQGLRRLKLRRIRQLAPELYVTARTQRWQPEEFLRVLVSEECAARDESNRELRLRTATFPPRKTLDEVDLTASTLSRTPSSTSPAWNGSVASATSPLWDPREPGNRAWQWPWVVLRWRPAFVCASSAPICLSKLCIAVSPTTPSAASSTASCDAAILSSSTSSASARSMASPPTICSVSSPRRMRRAVW